MTARLVWILAGLAAFPFGACSEKPAASTPFDTTLSTQQLMLHVIDPAAVGLWGRAGDVTTESGVEDLAPDTEEEWAAAESEAAVIAEAGNLLILPSRVRVIKNKAGQPDPEIDGGDWTKFALGMTKQALAAKAATAARDKEKMFQTGGDLYQACVACHEKYYLPFLEEGKMPNPDAPK